MGIREFLGIGKGFESEENPNPQDIINESIGQTNNLLNPLDFSGVPEGSFIGDSFYDTGGIFGRSYNQAGILEIERGYIMQQRAMSIYPEVAIGIEEIMKDLYIKDNPISLEIRSTDEPLIDSSKIYGLFEEFKEAPFSVIGGSNTPSGLLFFNLLKQAYVDGRLIILACEAPETWESQTTNYYKPFKSKSKKPAIDAPNSPNVPNVGFLNESRFLNPAHSLVHGYSSGEKSRETQEKIKNGDLNWLLEQQDLKILEAKNKESKKDKEAKETKESKLVFIPLDPARITVDNVSGSFQYDIQRGTKITLRSDRVIMADFGLYDVTGAKYGFLQYAFKYANQLQTLQDMLVPMRFRRSIARRVFNVDVGNLPQARATEYMKDLQSKFKYKKNYNVKNGRINVDDKEPVGIVEDYWFANRAGGKGTTVDMIDEAGNFADSLEDILYFNKKLYQAMFIPLRRIFESEAEYDYTASTMEMDETRFHNFLERLRYVYNSVFSRMFHIFLRERGIDEILLASFEVKLNYDNWFEENKKFERFERAVGMWEDGLNLVGKAYSAETFMNHLFGFNPSDFQEEKAKIKAELEETSVYHTIYATQAADAEDDY